MIVEASGIALPLDAMLGETQQHLERAAAQALGCKTSDIASVKLLRRSIDARKNSVKFIVTLAIDCPSVQHIETLHPAKGIHIQPFVPHEPLDAPMCELPTGEPRPVVVGSGPAGLCAALYLAKAGLKPIMLERGGSVDERVQAVDAFNAGEDLNLQTNIQFGEGGAGTFSDGKLTTGTKSPLQRDVLEWFVQAGAPEEILVLAKPHIGTDNLRVVVKNLRAEIESLGGTVIFHAQLRDIELDEKGKLYAIVVNARSKEAAEQLLSCYPDDADDSAQVGSAGQAGGAYHADVANEANGANGVNRVNEADGSFASCEITIPAHKLILACGHSARDTFKMLRKHQVYMEQKPFSVGVRIEHLQHDINAAQYGKFADHPALGAADYKMSVHLPNGRSVYTFCMCPGGEVVAAASEEYGVVVNGMSQFARDGENANAALLVNVGPDDFEGNDPLAGMVFQRRIEQEAFGEAHEMGGEAWQAPAQTVGDFLSLKAGNPSNTIKPTYARGVIWCDLREVLPDFICDSIELALPLFDKKLKGFANPDAVMTGVETRSSSPVRIVRDPDTLQAQLGETKKVRARDAARGHGAPLIIHAEDIGIYPCGEGAGYAGGIMSAAVDGIRCAQMLARSYELEDTIEQAVEALKRGEAVIFPTDTVYGLGVAVNHAESPRVLYDLKERDAGKPVAWLIGSIDDLKTYGKNITDEVVQAAKREWPGALTVIVEASDEVPEAYRSQEGTIGLRLPSSKLVRELVRKVGSPLATTSANYSGEPATRTLADIATQLREKVSVVIQDDAMGQGSASTVIDYSHGSPTTVRS